MWLLQPAPLFGSNIFFFQHQFLHIRKISIHFFCNVCIKKMLMVIMTMNVAENCWQRETKTVQPIFRNGIACKRWQHNGLFSEQWTVFTYCNIHTCYLSFFSTDTIFLHIKVCKLYNSQENWFVNKTGKFQISLHLCSGKIWDFCSTADWQPLVLKFVLPSQQRYSWCRADGKMVKV